MIISYIIVVLLIAAIAVWIAGLIQLKEGAVQESIWAELGIFFAMCSVFISGKLTCFVSIIIRVL